MSKLFAFKVMDGIIYAEAIESVWPVAFRLDYKEGRPKRVSSNILAQIFSG